MRSSISFTQIPTLDEMMVLAILCRFKIEKQVHPQDHHSVLSLSEGV